MSNKPEYIFSYFDTRARGEVVRQLFKLADVEFVDRRIAFSDWSSLKDSTPGGQLPVLELSSGVFLTQTMSIARYLANEFNLIGSTNQEHAICDIISTSANEVVDKTYQFYSSKTDEAKTAAKGKLEAVLGTMEECIIRYQRNNSHFVLGDQPSLCDTAIHATMEYVATHAPDLISKYATIARVATAFSEVPRISKWIKERPKPKN